MRNAGTQSTGISEPPPFTLRPLDRYFGEWVRHNFDDTESGVVLEQLARAVSCALGEKHTCLDLDSIHKLNDASLSRLLSDINANTVLGLSSSAFCQEIPNKPLVRSECGRYVWMQKFFQLEQQVARSLKEMALLDSKFKFNHSVLEQVFEKTQNSSEHKDAVALACQKRFAVITGGPGTGKTWTVARMIKVLLDSNPDRELKIELAAPTGKAAFRMMESLDNEIESLGIPQNARPDRAKTLHSLLKFNPNAARPRRDASNPLNLDILIIDEASMVALPMMARLLSALPTEANLILLGDKDQLSSVEAGSVLADICTLESMPVATITESHRFDKDKGIGAWAEAINAGNPANLRSDDQVSWIVPSAERAWKPDWLQLMVDHFKLIRKSITNDTSPMELLERQSKMQLLCALNHGPYGVSGINEMIARGLGISANAWKEGAPIMITRNDPEQGVFNGDVGLILPVSRDEDGTWQIDRENGKLRACFPNSGGNGNVRSISENQLPSYRPCYAMTVHKSQGSEYDTVLLVLPADDTEHKPSRVLTRELLYTGVTRAKEKVTISSGKKVLEAAIQTKTIRMSGLPWHAVQLDNKES